MITPNPLILLSARGFNEIAQTFNAYLGFVGINGGSIVHGQESTQFIADDVNQFVNESDFIAPIEEGSSDTLLSAERLNQLIKAYNRIVRSQGGGGCAVHLSDAVIVVEVFNETKRVSGGGLMQIDLVVEGDAQRTAISREIYYPICKLANAIQNIRGQNCEVYRSEGRLVWDLQNSVQPDPDGDPDDGIGGGGPPPPGYPFPGDGGNGEPPPSGGEWTSGFFLSQKSVKHYKFGFRPFDDVDNFTGIRYLKRDITFTNLQTTHDFSLNIGGTFLVTPGDNRYTTERRNRFASPYLNEQWGLGAILYIDTSYNTSGTWNSRERMLTQTGVTASEKSFTWLSSVSSGAVATGTQTNQYTTEQLYNDVRDLIANCPFKNGLSTVQFAGSGLTFDQPSGPYTSGGPSTKDGIQNGYTDEAQGPGISCGTNSGLSGLANLVAYHFTIKNLGGGSIAAPTGKTVEVEMAKFRFGHKTLTKTYYLHSYNTPKGHYRPYSSAVGHTSGALPSSSEYDSSTSFSMGPNILHTVSAPAETGYILVSESATPPAPTTPGTVTVVNIGLVKIFGNFVYSWKNDEGYLSYEIWRNTTNNTATATLITTLATPVGTMNGEIYDTFDGLYGFSYTDTGPFVGGTTYFYWHKAYFSTARKTGFSAVKSATY